MPFLAQSITLQHFMLNDSTELKMKSMPVHVLREEGGLKSLKKR